MIKMKPLKRISFLTIIAFFLLSLGYYRDFVFIDINARLKALDHNIAYTLSPSLQFLENYTYNTLLNFKWLLTLLFSAAYLALTILTIQLIFKNKKHNHIILIVYAGLTLISMLFIGTGLLFEKTSGTMYEIARYLMGMAQSPIILMILIPAIKLSEKEKNYEL